jgi:SAM-dependent methyltransferase
MPGQSTHTKRRYGIGAFHSRYFVGRGIDVGGGTDPLSANAHAFALITRVDVWDTPQGDAQKLAGIARNTYDFLHSTHTLEHMVDPKEALAHWIRVVRPGGYLILTVPDEDLYEKGFWPSRFNADHKWTFTIYKRDSWNKERSINVIDLCALFSDYVQVEKIELVRDFFDERQPTRVDQTKRSTTAECSIEWILRKRPRAAAAAKK